MTLKAWFKQCNNGPCILYIENELGTVIVIIYVYYKLEIVDKPEFMNFVECIKKEYATQSMGELGEFVRCTINNDLTKTTLNIFNHI